MPLSTALRNDRPDQGLVLALTCAATAMTGIDTAVLNVALASMQRDLGTGPGTLQWVVVAYALLLGGFLLLGGRLADHLGRRRPGSCRPRPGGAVGVAAVSTVLVAGSGLDGFHTAFGFVALLALLGILTAAVGFARNGRRPATR
ncbi:MFS transporter [Geodermatophilus sp. YIM 151500]|uniref:MFS transporter n=1 Tax=Geodermatophilus sp. YIM 151500 TaxID=2984531 RepID=UPI0021E43210|nr:MFS transporter [Geodermatophilus sp. YIM 151500]MCV2489784.1 MFS transporter [Geodermatophilus sp. YIM 151500]